MSTHHPPKASTSRLSLVPHKVRPPVIAPSAGHPGVADITPGPVTSRELRLVTRPGQLGPADLELCTADVPRVGPGQVLVRNTWVSVDRYVRGRMDNIPAPTQPPYQLGSALDGAAVGEVVTTRSDDLPAGTTVLHFLGWREYAVVDATDALVVDTHLAPAQAYLGVLGIPGLTAYAALTAVAALRPGDVVFIADATTPVGNAAGQIARKLGASEVIGSAGGPEDTLAALDVHGYDLVVDHHAGSVGKQLNRLVPDGIDVYVGPTDGPLLEAALETLRTGGRAALVSPGNDSCVHHRIPGPHNLHTIVDKQLSLHGVHISKHLAAFPDYIRRAAGWLADGSLHSRELVYHGLDQASPALAAMERSSSHHDRVLVRLHP